ncbi:MAG TPA: hypothetical protein VF372_02685 [Thermodesulfobacteriota bacterium]
MFTIAIAFSAKKKTCGPEARALRGKSIGSVISDFGSRISDFLDFFFNPHSAIGIPQFEGGPIGRPAGRPYNGINLSTGKEWLARPVQEMKGASWFFRAMPLLPGRAMLEIQ